LRNAPTEQIIPLGAWTTTETVEAALVVSAGAVAHFCGRLLRRCEDCKKNRQRKKSLHDFHQQQQNNNFVRASTRSSKLRECRWMDL
jgi:hypothetical protein